MTSRIPLPDSLSTAPFHVQSGRDAGLSEKRLRSRDLHRPFHGVRSSNLGELTIVELCQAYGQRMHPHARFSGVTAAVVMSVPLPRRLESLRTLHITVPAPLRAPSGRRIVGHSAREGENDVRLWNGLRLSSPERLWCELGAVLAIPDLVAAGDYLVHWRLPHTTVARLSQAVDHYAGRRGRATLRESLPLLHERSESPKESQLRVIVVQAQITGLAVNLPITTADGYRYRADLAFLAEKVILEYQGDHHRTPENYRADMTRISRLEADGWYVIQVNADDLRNPEELVRRIRRVLVARTPH